MQAEDPSNVVFGLVRNRDTSLPALLELENVNKNVHVLEADVTNDAQVAVCLCLCMHNLWNQSLSLVCTESGRAREEVDGWYS